MKRRILFLAAVVVGMGLAACSADTSEIEKAGDDLKQEVDAGSDQTDETNRNAQEAIPAATYQCPDDCENGPSYDKPGPCPKCGKEMDIL